MGTTGERRTTIFLASRFEEFRGLRGELTKRFGGADAREIGYKLLDINSESRGRPHAINYSLSKAASTDVLVLLVGETYPERNTGTNGRLVCHDEYLAACAAAHRPPIFVFLSGDSYRNAGTSPQTQNRRLKALLEQIHDNNRACDNHTTLVLPADKDAGNAQWIFTMIHSKLAYLEHRLLRAGASRSVKDQLNDVVMSSREHDSLELASAGERLQALNDRARTAFHNREVPDKPFPRTLLRLDDCRHEVRDFETRLAEPECGKVLGIICPSGQGKSTFVCDFPRRYGVDQGKYLFLVGRELRSQDFADIFTSVALTAKQLGPVAGREDRLPTEWFYVLVDALNECVSDAIRLDLIIWLEELLDISVRSHWPIAIILTMRPGVAKRVPELSRQLVLPGNTYQFVPFGEREYHECAARHGLLTRYRELSPALQRHLEDPFMLRVVAQLYQGRAIPPEFSELELLSRYLNRLAAPHVGSAPDKTVLEAAWKFGGELLARATQTVHEEQLAQVLSPDEIESLMVAGIITDQPEQARSRTGGTDYGFRYDRVAEYCIGRSFESHLRTAAPGKRELELNLVELLTRELTVARFSEMHWNGVSIALHLLLDGRGPGELNLLSPLIRHSSPQWRMLARNVLLRLNATESERSGLGSIVRELIKDARDPNSPRELRPETMRACFEIARTRPVDPAMTRSRARLLEDIIEFISEGLNSQDQEISDQAISSLAALTPRSDLVPILVRWLGREIDKIDVSLTTVLRKQIAANVAIGVKQVFRRPGANGAAAIPLFATVRLLIVCFASSLDEEGRTACLKLLSILLGRMRKAGFGQALRTSFGRRFALSLLSTMLDTALRFNAMPINSKEWRQLLRDPEQASALRRAIAMAGPAAPTLDTERLVAMALGANPFVYQTFLTAVSSRYELCDGGVPSQIRAHIRQIVSALIAADRGDGTCKYIASLVLYHINTFGDHGDVETGRMMVELAADILRNHDGMFGGERKYSSNIIGTTGRSLLRLAHRGVIDSDGAFVFIREQMAKVKADADGNFTKYLLDNLALLAVLVPENAGLMQLIKDTVYEGALDAPRSWSAPAKLRDWLIDTFVRIRAVHPSAVDAFLVRDSVDDSEFDEDQGNLYRAVRDRHAKQLLHVDAQGLDSELISWSFERIAFDFVVRARVVFKEVFSRWCADLDAAPRIGSSCFAQLGLHLLDVGMDWAERYEKAPASPPA